MIGNFSLYFFHFFRSLRIYFMCSSIIMYSLRYYITILEKYFILLKLYYYFAYISRNTVVSRDNIIHTYCRHETFLILQFFSHVPLPILRQTQLINKLYSLLTFHFIFNIYIYIYIYINTYKNFNAGEGYSLALDYPKSLCRFFEMQRYFSI